MTCIEQLRGKELPILQTLSHSALTTVWKGKQVVYCCLPAGNYCRVNGLLIHYQVAGRFQRMERTLVYDVPMRHSMLWEVFVLCLPLYLSRFPQFFFLASIFLRTQCHRLIIESRLNPSPLPLYSSCTEDFTYLGGSPLLHEKCCG